MPQPCPFNGYSLDGVYLAAVVACAAGNQDAGSAQAAIQAYAPCNYKQYQGSQPFPTGYLFYTQYDLIAAFEPTTTVLGWIYNVLGSAQGPGAGVPGSIDQWFYTATVALYNAMANDIAGLQPGRRFTLIGNSLGGAIAQLMYHLTRQIGTPSTSIYTFGCPRVGDPVFAASFPTNALYRVENLDDPIPQLPPAVWAGVGSVFPIPGPPPFAVYQHAGQNRLLDYQGYLTAGSTQSALQLIVNALGGSQPIAAHFQAEYVRRLGLQLPLSYAGAGASFEVEAAAVETIIEPQNWRTQIVAQAFPAACKVEVFYSFQGDGFSEIWYSANTPQNLINVNIPFYVNARLTLATGGVQALYARVSQIGKPRQVQFWVPGFAYNGPILGSIKGSTSGSQQNVVPQAYKGSWNGFDVQPQQALLVRIQNAGNFWTRMFLHGFPAEVITGGFYTPTPAWVQAFNQFVAFLQGAQSGWLSVSTSPNFIGNRVSITSIVANPGRGATVLYTIPNPTPPSWPPVVGSYVTVGGAGALEVGMNGRKVVIGTVVNPPAGQGGIIVGGASPIGAGPQSGQAYFYLDVLNAFALQSAQVERVTTRKVGKPVFEPVGRRRNTIPLRR